MTEEDLGAIARAIIDANLYMTLGTVDDDDKPCVAPVFYAAHGYTEFYWISVPDVTHSRNLAQRPHASIVIFDSRVPAGTGQAVYMSAVVQELSGADLDRAVEVYPGPAERGGRTVAPEELRPPGSYRMYRATVSQHSILCPRGSGPRSSGPCALHGRAHDHRTEVTV